MAEGVKDKGDEDVQEEERRRAKRETTNGDMILNGEQVLTMRLVVVFVFSAPRPLVWDITF